MTKARAFTFTLNNYSDDEVKSLRNIDHDYIVYGKEIASTGTPHLQGYMHFKSTRSFNAVKKLVPRAHIQIARGSPSANFNYCTKEDTEGFFELGDRPQDPADSGRKEKERWSAAFESARKGNIDEIPGDIKLRNWNAINSIKKHYMVPLPDLEDVCGIWYWGVPGSGKSFKARQDFPDFYTKLCNKWWDGYQMQENVIIDDFELKADGLGHHLKIWADRYSFIAEIKGGALSIRPKRIIVTSNYSIEEIFGTDPEMVKAVRRRFDVTHFPKSFKKDMQLDVSQDQDAQTQEVSEIAQVVQESPYEEALNNANFSKGHSGFYGGKVALR